MEKEHIKMAILRQEQMFKQQVHELHRVYQVQKQLMMEIQIVELNQAQASANSETKPKVEILHHISNVDQKQSYSYLDEKKASFIEDFDLELTLATGSSRRKQQKSSNSNSGATVSSSTSSESESGRFREPNVTLRFQNESKRHDGQMLQSPWLYQCLSLKSA